MLLKILICTSHVSFFVFFSPPFLRLFSFSWRLQHNHTSLSTRAGDVTLQIPFHVATAAAMWSCFVCSHSIASVWFRTSQNLTAVKKKKWHYLTSACTSVHVVLTVRLFSVPTSFSCSGTFWLHHHTSASKCL